MTDENSKRDSDAAANGPTIFDTFRVRDGRGIGEVRFNELDGLIAENKREAAILSEVLKIAKARAGR